MVIAEHTGLRKRPDERVNWVSSIAFLAVHALCLAAIFTCILP